MSLKIKDSPNRLFKYQVVKEDETKIAPFIEWATHGGIEIRIQPYKAFKHYSYCVFILINPKL